MSATGRHSGKRRKLWVQRSQLRFSGVADADPPRARRVALLGTLGAVLVLTAFGVARLGPVSWDCPSWAPRAIPQCAPPPNRYPIEDYLTTTPGRAPAKYPEHADFLGLGDGTTPSVITAAFPPATSHQVYPSHAGRHRESWTWEGVHYMATIIEATGRTTGTYVFRDDDSPYYVAAPNYLLLGSTTIQDATYWNGAIDRIAPHATGWYAEFSPAYAGTQAGTNYLAKARAGGQPSQHSGPPYVANSAPCLAVLYLETVASPAGSGLGAVPSLRAGETSSCR